MSQYHKSVAPDSVPPDSAARKEILLLCPSLACAEPSPGGSNPSISRSTGHAHYDNRNVVVGLRGTYQTFDPKRELIPEVVSYVLRLPIGNAESFIRARLLDDLPGKRTISAITELDFASYIQKSGVFKEDVEAHLSRLGIGGGTLESKLSALERYSAERAASLAKMPYTPHAPLTEELVKRVLDSQWRQNLNSFLVSHLGVSLKRVSFKTHRDLARCIIKLQGNLWPDERKRLLLQRLGVPGVTYETKVAYVQENMRSP